MGLPRWLSGEKSTCQCRRCRFDPWVVGSFPGGGNGNPLRYPCLENPVDRGAWRATVHGVAKSRTWLKRPSTQLYVNMYSFSDFFPFRLLQDIQCTSWCYMVGPCWLSSLYVYACSIAHSCLTLCDPVDCSPPGSSVHEILQARILEWVAMPSSGGSSRPRGRTCLSCLGE